MANAKNTALARSIVEWASSRFGPYSDAHKANMVIQLIKSGANLKKLSKLGVREKMHDINFITVTGDTTGLFCSK